MIIRKCDVCDISVGDEFLCVSPCVLSKHFRTKEKKTVPFSSKPVALFQSRCFLTESDVFIAAINKTLAGSLFFSPDLQKRLTSTTIGESEMSHAKMKVLTQRSGAKRWP